MSYQTQGRMIAELSKALRSARRIIAQDRNQIWEDCTIPPNRSFDHMNNNERAIVKSYDRVIAKIDKALQ